MTNARIQAMKTVVSQSIDPVAAANDNVTVGEVAGWLGARVKGFVTKAVTGAVHGACAVGSAASEFVDNTRTAYKFYGQEHDVSAEADAASLPAPAPASTKKQRVGR